MVEENKCAICSHKGKRSCPELRGTICSVCCGEKRGSELSCPPRCSHFPFGIENYDGWLKIDGSWMQKAVHYIMEHVDRDRFKQVARRMDSEGGSSARNMEIAFPATVYYLLGIDRDDEGKTLAERWEEEGWHGLDNDERVMMRYRRESFPTIIEVQKVLDVQSLECIDLLDPDKGPFVIFDRTFAQNAHHFSRFLLWLTHYPYFSRPGGGGLLVNYPIYHDFYNDLKKRAGKKRGKRIQLSQVKEYMAGHFGECCALIESLGKEYSNQLIRSLDANQCVAKYMIRSSWTEIKDIIKQKPDFQFDEKALKPDDPEGTRYYQWLRRGESKKVESSMHPTFRHYVERDGVGSLGTLKLCPDCLIVEILSRQKFEFAKGIMEKHFGSLVELVDETIEDLSEGLEERLSESQDLAAREDDGYDYYEQEKEDEDIPPEIQQKILERFYRKHYTNFLNDPIPALNGLTPRQASNDLEMRERLLDLMKGHLYHLSLNTREKGIKLDIDWVLEELGLHELL